jgi:hypothetical protein
MRSKTDIEREALMKMNPIDFSELIEVEELEEKSAPSADTTFVDLPGATPATLL